jgi:hypothetical protein
MPLLIGSSSVMSQPRSKLLEFKTVTELIQGLQFDIAKEKVFDQTSLISTRKV